MNAAVLERSDTLTILSVEDEPETMAGTLSSLEYLGHRVRRVSDAEAARDRLVEQSFQLLILDQRLGDDDQGGSRLIFDLKHGLLGPRNADVEFVFVTGSRAWITEPVEDLDGYLCIEEKGGDLTPRLRRHVERVSATAEPQAPAVLERVMVRIERVLGSHRPPAVEAVIPSWSARERIRFALDALPSEWRAQDLAGQRLLAWGDPDADRSQLVELRGFELAPLPDDDDGLA